MYNRDAILNVLTTILVCSALIIAVLVVWQQVVTEEPSESNMREIEGWREVSTDGHRMGPENVAVEIVEFFDYQCAFCRQVHPTLKEIWSRYPERVALIFRHFPLPNHPQALPAALAAECAAQQGRFAEYHALLFDHQTRLGESIWDSLAVEAGIPNFQAYRSCIAGKQATARIKRDIQAAQRLNIHSVPTLIVNGRVVPGAVSVEVLDKLVTEALRK
mgnify:CR=1 FL=1